MARLQNKVWDLNQLRGLAKRDPGGYHHEFSLQYSHYKATREIFMLQPSKNSKDFADLIQFIAQVSHFYPNDCIKFPGELMELLETHATVLDVMLRRSLVQSLILLRNKGIVTAHDILPLFFKLFRCQDKMLRRLVFQHIVADLQRSNAKHRNDKLNRKIQNFLYSMVTDDNEISAKKSLCVLTQMYKKKVWCDANTVNVVASAVFHKSSRIMVAAMKFFMGHDDVDSDVESDDEMPPEVYTSREDRYKAFNKGTRSSKKKKQMKLKRVQNAMKKAQKDSLDAGKSYSFTAIQLLHDPQSFGERLFSKLNRCNERWETKLLMMNVISRVIGVHQLLVLHYYSFLQKYLQPHQREVTSVLSALIQATHGLVPDDVLLPVTKQLCNNFINETSRPEVMVVGLRTVREMCARQPLIMNPDLLQDLTQYRKFRDKGVSMAAKSLISLFRIVAPNMLHKKDRGKGADMDASVKAFGEFKPATGVDGIELLQQESSESELSNSDLDEDESKQENLGGNDSDGEVEINEMSDEEEVEEGSDQEISEDEGASSQDDEQADQPTMEKEETVQKGLSLRQLKKMAAQSKKEKKEEEDFEDGILSQEDFERIKRLKQRQLEKSLMQKYGIQKDSIQLTYSVEETEKLLDSKQMISDRKVDADSLAYTKQYRRTKEERLKSVLEGREGRESYSSAASRSKTKSGGLSNREKRKRMILPLAARAHQAKKRARGPKKKKQGKRK